MKKTVMLLAHQVKKHFKTFSEALIFAWKKCKLQKKLRSGIAVFTFIKKSTGKIRKAKGTLLLNDTINYNVNNTVWYIQKFKDVEIKEWRSLDIRTLKKIYI